MNKYIIKYEHLKATEESPSCIIEGQTEVFADSKDSAIIDLKFEASRRGLKSFAIMEIDNG